MNFSVDIDWKHGETERQRSVTHVWQKYLAKCKPMKYQAWRKCALVVQPSVAEICRVSVWSHIPVQTRFSVSIRSCKVSPDSPSSCRKRHKRGPLSCLGSKIKWDTLFTLSCENTGTQTYVQDFIWTYMFISPFFSAVAYVCNLLTICVTACVGTHGIRVVRERCHVSHKVTATLSSSSSASSRFWGADQQVIIPAL